MNAITANRLSLCAFIYAVFSHILFVFTSGGWTGVFISYLGFWMWCGLFVIFTVSLSIKKIASKKDVFYVNTQWLFLLLSLQIGVALLNIGDCGDSRGSYFFFQTLITRFVGNQEVCSLTLPTYVGYFWLFLLISYLTTLLFGVIRIPVQANIAHSKGK